MVDYKKVRELKKEEAAYLAGIIDGEGTVTLTRRNRNDQRQLAVTVSSTDRHLLEYVLQIVGVGKITNKRMNRSNHSPAYTYQLSNRQALSLLKQIAPFLRTYKRDRARVVLDGYLKVTPRNGKYSTEMLGAKEKFNSAFFAFSSPNAKRLE
ncbi:MAG TPA: LAGLIDADG family homing endonuclease [Candidatus Paceibacterota bacterium]|uniref:Homing endonuclease LAGLIDADG domain-containing protein n=1 Tax=Candidatus Kaiserbacteria bacterium RIFCSPHIGHO2_02_FULL_55_20 TaxID=1798497 RepID=A0A1F6DY56_9BACT|nr:MAG: hypothetical protein A3D71_00215 [Candidatus Kaiserbacteria bacterium RIFCSPHIGHO2_02_FULL_55_20]